MTGTPAGLIVRHGTDYANQETVNPSHLVTGRFVLPVEPEQMWHAEAFTIDNDTASDCWLRVRAAWKGTVLWMPNSGRDTNYVNLGYWWHRTKHANGISATKPGLDDMTRSKKMRQFSPDGNGYTRHMVTGNGTEFYQETKLNAGRAATYWLASSAQIDESRDTNGLRPTIFAWGGIGVQWELVTR